MKKFFNYFVLLGFVFLGIALFKIDFLVIPSVLSKSYAIASILTLFVGFLLESYVWKRTLAEMGLIVSLKDAISSVGLSVFGKYIPGKIWIVLGRAGYLSSLYSYSVKKLAFCATSAQMISLWVGLGFGIIGLVNLSIPILSKTLIVSMWCLISFFALLPISRRWLQVFARKLTRGKYEIPFLDGISLLKLAPSYIVRWIFFSLSYYFLLKTFIGESLPWYAATIYPLAGTLGLLAFFLPGGIGVREAVMVFFFTRMGFDVGISIGLSYASRIWYLLGEVYIFLIAVAGRRTLEGQQ